MGFPQHRLRRLRQSEPIRRMVRETRLSTADLIQPFFVTAGQDRREEIPSMPGQFRLSVDLLVKMLLRQGRNEELVAFAEQHLQDDPRYEQILSLARD